MSSIDELNLWVRLMSLIQQTCLQNNDSNSSGSSGEGDSRLVRLQWFCPGFLERNRTSSTTGLRPRVLGSNPAISLSSSESNASSLPLTCATWLTHMCDMTHGAGDSTVVSVGLLNLTHRHSHSTPTPLPIDTAFTVNITLGWELCVCAYV